MRTTLTRALVGLGLAGALFLGAGAAAARAAPSEAARTAARSRPLGGPRRPRPRVRASRGV
jgi:hypothetical protein